jgi:hypothetical protein
MMHSARLEFNNRIAAQRQIVQMVNRSGRWKEELVGLSIDAIERWANTNRLEQDGQAVQILLQSSKKLQCLASKSQEQVSPEYITVCNEIASLMCEVRESLG